MNQNNHKVRIRFSSIEVRMILTDMDKRQFSYNGNNKDSHNLLMKKLRKYI